MEGWLGLEVGGRRKGRRGFFWEKKMTTTYPISLRVKMIRETEEFLEENLPVAGMGETQRDVQEKPREMGMKTKARCCNDSPV